MQEAYMVVRDGEEMLVPTDQLTDLELEELETRFLSEAFEHDQHAAALEAYVKQRRAPGREVE